MYVQLFFMSVCDCFFPVCTQLVTPGWNPSGRTEPALSINYLISEEESR